MKIFPLRFSAIFLSFSMLNGSATPRYVDLNSPSPTPPFTDWSTAATNIQDAIDASVDGDAVFVTNGVYAVGGRVMAGDLINRVALNKAVTVQSVNGPFATVIQGAGATNGTTAVRCAWLTNGAVLSGFTLQRGATRTSGDPFTLQSGGGAWCASSNATVANCVVKTNTANGPGGVCYLGTLNNCLVIGNSVSAVYNGSLINCTVTRNSSVGTVQGRLTNCLVYFNGSGNYSGGTFAFCCSTPLPSGIGNINADPQLFADSVHLSNPSPCRSAGTNLASGTDIDGQPWNNPPSIGCDEWQPVPLIIFQPRIQLTSDPVGFTIDVAAAGQEPFICWWTRDGVPLENDGHYSSAHTTNLVAVGINQFDPGNYQVVVSNASGVATSSVARIVVHFANGSAVNPVAPYSTWATAATNIQDAITVSAAGEIVLVTNGFYDVGGKSMDGVITNRVSVDKAILVQSVNGPSTTIIQGAWDPTSTNGPGAVRCVWLTNNATLSGFTLRGGATRSIGASVNQSMNGGGAWAASTNATTANCLITGNFASNKGGGAYQLALKNCMLSGNHAVGSGTPGAGVASAGSGGGAANCNLKNCYIASNYADQLNGGGTDNCNLRNCALMKNSSFLNGGGANLGLLINCTVSGNISSGYSSGYGGAVYGATLTNCVVWGNIQRTSYPYTNYANANCVLSYCDADPLPSGTGNIDIDPQLLPDGVHLGATSPCIGAGTNSVVMGTDIDGQPWSNPASIGCDEWQPAPVIGMQPSCLVGFPAHGLTFNLVVAGQSPFNYYWSKDGTLIQNDSHHSLSGTANLVVNNFGPDDAGNYQVVVSNAFGVVTSTMAQVVIHAVDVAGVNPAPPFSTWASAATNIQDAINIAAAGDIVLVTNGVYATGGKVEAGDLTNRVAMDKPITVTSVNGYAATVIQGAWDPATTNGPLAVRCAWLTDGATLNGFTLQNGATRPFSGFVGAPAESGGGAWCVSTNSVISNCLISNNAANYGGGIAFGTLHNSFVINNTGFYSGGGAYMAVLDNCTVLYNYTFQFSGGSFGGGGTFQGTTRNSIVWNNYRMLFGFPNSANYSPPGSQSLYSYCLTSPLISGTGNINADPAFLDLMHISSTSPCLGTGSSLYAFGTDVDGELWANPPSMGCDEVVESALTGPLAVTIQAPQTNSLVNRNLGFWGLISGRVTRLEWSFGDGPTVTNVSYNTFHTWVNSGDYTVTFTAYNTDNPAGVSTNLLVHISPFNPPLLQSAVLLTNGFQFQFTGQLTANYIVQYTTNLAPPATWQTLQNIFSSSDGVQQVTDSTVPNGTRFYRVLAQ